jgi:hypothetical protein
VEEIIDKRNWSEAMAVSNGEQRRWRGRESQNGKITRGNYSGSTFGKGHNNRITCFSGKPRDQMRIRRLYNKYKTLKFLIPSEEKVIITNNGKIHEGHYYWQERESEDK